MNKKEVKEWLIAIVIGFILVFGFKALIATNYHIIGESMMPTLSDKDRVIVSKLSSLERMDIVIFRSGEEDFVKRVIGLPGDTIHYENDQLFINGKYIEEPFLQSHLAYKQPEIKFTEDFELHELTGSKRVPKNKVFVLGDNRLSSLDSRHFSFVEKEDIVGVVKARYWPISDMTIFLHSE